MTLSEEKKVIQFRIPQITIMYFNNKQIVIKNSIEVYSKLSECLFKLIIKKEKCKRKEKSLQNVEYTYTITNTQP